jgi:hypothetical protein
MDFLHITTGFIHPVEISVISQAIVLCLLMPILFQRCLPELLSRLMTYRAFLRRLRPFMDITAYTTDKSFHTHSLLSQTTQPILAGNAIALIPLERQHHLGDEDPFFILPLQVTMIPFHHLIHPHQAKSVIFPALCGLIDPSLPLSAAL